MARINFDEVEEGSSFAIIPEGEYIAQIEAAETATGAKGEYWKIRLAITEGDYKGLKVFDNISFSEGALGIAKKFLKETEVLSLGATEYTPDMVIGAIVKVYVIIETYVDRNGTEKKTNKVRTASYESTKNPSTNELIGKEEIPF